MDAVLLNDVEWRVLVEVVGAMFLGAIIGFEREIHQKSAGLRTHMIVCGASTLIVILSNQLTVDMMKNLPDDFVQADPTRVIVAIIMGVSFIGAGTIIRNNRSVSEPEVSGLTTAASLLFTSAIGIAVAIERHIIAIVLTCVLVGITWGVGKLQAILGGKKQI